MLQAFWSDELDTEATGLQHYAGAKLPSHEAAIAHVTVIHAVAIRYGVDPYLVMAITDHESNFELAARTHEPLGKTSCGVMTAEPTYDMAQCELETRDLVVSYAHGAQHLAGWYRAGDVHSPHEALLGVAGGYVLLRACRQGPQVVHRHGRDYDVCLTPKVFEGMRSAIRAEIHKVRYPAL